MRVIPRIYLGTMTFAWSQTSSKVDERIAREMVQKFVTFTNEIDASSNNDDDTVTYPIDTARIYAGGKTEPCVAQALLLSSSKNNDVTKLFSIGTKAHPSQKDGLSKIGIQNQLHESLQALQVNHLNEYYLHQPDPNHSLLESLQCLHEYYQKGLISNIGMSNYHVSEVERAFQLCTEFNLTPPKVYQGLYNPLNRLVESELIPLLRKYNCSFVAYNPLAAGLLTGKYKLTELGDKVPKGRFKNNQNYLPRFYTNANHKAVELIRTACDDANITMVDATYRWLLCHSILNTNDGILLGASSIQQMDENLVACRAGFDEKSGNIDPLPESILNAFDKAWQITKSAGEVFPYWRSYSSDMPNRENLNQGASYDAVKK